MLNHLFTLFQSAKELQLLCGAELVSIFTQEKEIAILAFDDGEELHNIEISTLNKRDAIFVRKNFARARSNVQDIFNEAKGEILQEINIFNNDRIIHFKFINRNIWALLFGNGMSNLILTSSHNNILDALKNKKDLLNSNFYPEKRSIKKLIEQDSNLTLKDAIGRSDFFLGKYYLNEFAIRNNLDLKKILNQLNEDEIIRIQNLAYQFKGECLNSNQYFHLDNSTKIPLFSLIPLNEYKTLAIYDNISEAIQRKISKIHFVEDIENEIVKLKTEFEKVIRLNQNTIKKINELGDVKDRIAQNRTFAEILMSQANPKIKLGESLITQDWSGNEINIKLNPKLNLLENAKKYFDKAKGLNKENDILMKRLPEAELKLNAAKLAIEELNLISSFDGIKEFKQKHSKENKQSKNKSIVNLESKFRKFVIDDKNTLYVGKSALNNDELTQKFARPNDIWLHARGVGGSHCVLKTIGGKVPSKEALERAAEITAYYSQARGGSFVPVAYCEKKYVRKPKGANIGAVIMQKEEVIMVEPKL